MADPSSAVVVVGGVNVTRFARVGSVRIDDVLNDAPNTAALTLVLEKRAGAIEGGAFAPHAFDNRAFQTAQHAAILTPPTIAAGAPVQIYCGSITPAAQIFGGEITTREQYAEFDQPKHVRVDLGCVDFTRALNRRKVVKEYLTASATAIVVDMIATFAPAITTANVAPGLPSLSGGITFTWEEVSRALSRIAEKIGAYWYVDYSGDLHFFTGTEAGATPAPIVLGADFAALKITADLTQVRTRILVEGDGGTVAATIPAGDPIVPLSQTLPFNPAGGLAKIGASRVSYGGIQLGGAKTNTAGVAGPGTGGTPPPTPPGPPTVAVAAAGTAGALSGGPYYYGVTFELADGTRSGLGGNAGPVSITPAANPAVTNAALAAVPTKGPIAVGVNSLYATSFVAANGAQTGATVGGNALAGRPVATPSASPVVTILGITGAIVPGSYYYAITYLTPAGETLPAVLLQPFVMASGDWGTWRVTFPNSPDGRVIGRRLYRSSVGPIATGAALVLPWRHLADVPNNDPGVFFDDKYADVSLPPRNLPAFSSATDVGEMANVTVPTSADPRVARRRLYRKDGPGEYRLIAEIPDNVTATFADVVVGPGGDLAPKANTITTGAVNVSAIPIGPAGTVRRRLFRNRAGGSEFRELVSINDNTTTAYLDTEADSTLGGAPLPAQGGLPTSGTAAPPAPAGATSLQVDDVAGFPAAGWAFVESQLIRYTATPAGFLTGIPASGPGALTADVPVGTVVTAAPALTGVSPVVPVTLGDAAQLIAQVDDVPAQSALAAVEGGDGIIEHYIQDRRLSEAGARGRGLAELALFKTVETRLHYSTHDVNTRSGRTVHVDLPAPTSLVGDFLIQRVTIDDVSIAANWQPRRTVEASTTRFSFDDVLSRILMEQT